MGKYVQATTFRVKEGQLDDATAELRKWIDGYAAIGAEATIYMQVGGGTSGEAMIGVEFPDGDTWMKVLEDPRLTGARARMTEKDWPFEPASTSVWQELIIDSDG